MSQHLIKEIHQLKHELQQLKEGVTPGQLLSEVQGRLEHIEKKLGIGEHDWLNADVDPHEGDRGEEWSRRQGR